MPDTAAVTLTDFLLARIDEDYASERGDAPDGSAREVSARMRVRVRRASIGFAMSMSGVPFERTEAARYADHPDYRDEWRP